jgi:hypothetical protein
VEGGQLEFPSAQFEPNQYPKEYSKNMAPLINAILNAILIPNFRLLVLTMPKQFW